jgi:hypothetical protein
MKGLLDLANTFNVKNDFTPEEEGGISRPFGQS